MAKTIPLVECWKFVGSTPKKYEGRKRYVSTGALEKDHINEADVENVTYEERPSRANLEAVAGDILFAKMASTEKTFVVDDVSAENIYSTGFCAVRADETKILPKCLYYFLSSPLFLEQKDKNSSGATQKAITNAGLAKITIKLPTLADQRMFVMQMDLLTDLISARKAQLEKLDQLVKSRFVELFGKWTSNPEPLKSFLEDITYGFTNPMPDAEEGPWKVTAKDVVNGKVNYGTARKTTVQAFDELTAKSKPAVGDVLLTKDGTLGRCAVVEEDGICVNQSVAVLKCNEKILPKFLAILLQMPEYQREMLKNAGGGTIKHIYITKVVDMLIVVPTISQQLEFLSFVEQTDKSKLAIQQSLDKPELLKKSLMQEYFE